MQITGARPVHTNGRVGQLILSVSLVMAGNGLLLTVLGVRATRAGFSDGVTGAILGAYYLGFLAGASMARQIMARFGLARTALYLIVSMALISAAPALAEVSGWWILLRAAQGFAISACYVVAETWLNGATGNDTRGRLLGIYMVSAMGAFACGALLYRVTGASGSLPFITAGAITACGAITMIGAHGATNVVAVRESVALSLSHFFRLAPVGASLGLIVGFANGAFSSISVYAERAQYSDSKTAMVSAVMGLGPIFVLFPLSSLSDRIARPVVIIFSAATAATLLVVSSRLTPAALPLMVALTLAGGITVGLYTLTSAETNDHVAPDQLAGASGHIVLLYGVGAVLGPIAITAGMSWLGPKGFFLILAAAHFTAVFIVVTVRVFLRRSRYSQLSVVGVGSDAP